MKKTKMTMKITSRMSWVDIGLLIIFLLLLILFLILIYSLISSNCRTPHK